MEIVKNSNLKNLLIVGGTGFIGTHLAKEAIKRGFNVSIFSKNYNTASERLEGVEYLAVDISSHKEVLAQLENKAFNYLINLGGYIDHSNYFDGGKKTVNTHLDGVKNLVNFINKESLICFIQIGSSDEYGDNPAPQSEDLRELPISSYSFAKTAATHFLQMLYITENFPVVILRPFLVYGPGQNSNRFIPQIINGCINNLDFPVSEGEQVRDFCYIDDIVDAIFLTLNNSKLHGEVFNIASGEPITIKDVIIYIQKIIGLGKPQFGKVSYRKGENMELYANIQKAKNSLKWKPKVDLQDGLKKTINYYLTK